VEKRVKTILREYRDSKSKRNYYVPSFTLNGKYLEDNGFVSGSKIEITIDFDTITIKPISKPEKQF